LSIGITRRGLREIAFRATRVSHPKAVGANTAIALVTLGSTMTHKLDGSSIARSATMHGTHTCAALPRSGAPHSFALVPRFAAAGLLLLLGGCFTVNSLVDEPDESPGDGVCARALTPADRRSGEPVNRCTLRAAVMEANASAWRPIIHVRSATYHLDLPIASGGGRRVIKHSMRIQGEGAATTIVGQTVSVAVIHIQGGSNLESNLLTAQASSSAGGGILNLGELRVYDSTIRNNHGGRVPHPYHDSLQRCRGHCGGGRRDGREVQRRRRALIRACLPAQA
jgi:CSLREA domain-containing protein